MGEILKGLCCYFDKALPALLLYQNERKQYQEACPGGTAPCAVYGAEHLLRLFSMFFYWIGFYFLNYKFVISAMEGLFLLMFWVHKEGALLLFEFAIGHSNGVKTWSIV